MADRRRFSRLAALLALVVGVSGAFLRAQMVSAQMVSAQMVSAQMKTRLPSVAFGVSCAPSHQANDDPIVHPGRAGASHRHQFFGNPTTAAASTLASMLRAGSTSCDDAADLASYWAPTPVGAQWIHLRAYYDAGSVDPSRIVAPPAGLMMIAGDHMATAPQGTDVVAWSCGRGVNTVGWSATPPRCAPGVALRARITFPQCWDGVVRAGAADVVAAGPAGCPAGHAIALPRLRIVLDASGPIAALSSGPVTGLHADFWNTWREPRLRDLVRWCIRGERSSNHQLRECRPKAGQPT